MSDPDIGFNFSLPYTQKFFSIHHVGRSCYDNVKRDFIYNLGGFLCVELSVPRESAASIAHATFEKMCDSNLHYHTPVHVLYMLQFAFEHDIKLDTGERLAIWFHDVIFYLDAEYCSNEEQSAAFMRAVIPHGTRLNDNADINFAHGAILATSQHIGSSPPKDDYNLVMDLDLAVLSAKESICKQANDCLKLEGSMIGDRIYLLRQNAFLEALSKREYIYRTPLFRKKFEMKAKSNVWNLQSLLVS